MSKERKEESVGESLMLSGREFQSDGAEKVRERLLEQDFMTGIDKRWASNDLKCLEGVEKGGFK